MRAIIDTNVLVSGFFWRNTPHALPEHVRNGELTLVISPVLLAELADVMGRPKFDPILARSHTSRSYTLDALRRLAEVVEAPPLPQPVCRDPDDDEVLAAAISGQVDLIVSGDNDLLCLNQHRNIPILSPMDALGFIEASR
ncbi:MAG: putative toxin-antitoxin system toxin component, PIN family [Acidiferrobacteraceae bacterium]